MKKYPKWLFYFTSVLGLVILLGFILFYYMLLLAYFGGDAATPLVILVPTFVITFQALIAGYKTSYFRHFTKKGIPSERFISMTLKRVIFKSMLIIFLIIILMYFGYFALKSSNYILGIFLYISGVALSFLLIKYYEFLGFLRYKKKKNFVE